MELVGGLDPLPEDERSQQARRGIKGQGRSLIARLAVDTDSTAMRATRLEPS